MGSCDYTEEEKGGKKICLNHKAHKEHKGKKSSSLCSLCALWFRFIIKTTLTTDLKLDLLVEGLVIVEL